MRYSLHCSCCGGLEHVAPAVSFLLVFSGQPKPHGGLSLSPPTVPRSKNIKVRAFCLSLFPDRYRGSKQEEDHQLKAAKRLGKALYQHIKNDPTRNYITREDFDPFFAGLHNAEAEADAAFFFFDKVRACGPILTFEHRMFLLINRVLNTPPWRASASFGNGGMIGGSQFPAQSPPNSNVHFVAVHSTLCRRTTPSLISTRW